ncbi:hypothetical protein HK105_202561 [Polyrhizophydium stewartii]|uniref:C2H2-type domain-containing protein n=1 Tax=Polyrhizophydium stewartii TaxID=2732419 RepID=A0ABR4NDU1_9FUNG|nr:hypothetical protein HK105_000877 [Polyrhizophydium stewartii]
MTPHADASAWVGAGAGAGTPADEAELFDWLEDLFAADDCAPVPAGGAAAGNTAHVLSCPDQTSGILAGQDTGTGAGTGAGAGACDLGALVACDANDDEIQRMLDGLFAQTAPSLAHASAADGQQPSLFFEHTKADVTPVVLDLALDAPTLGPDAAQDSLLPMHIGVLGDAHTLADGPAAADEQRVAGMGSASSTSSSARSTASGAAANTTKVGAPDAAAGPAALPVPRAFLAQQLPSLPEPSPPLSAPAPSRNHGFTPFFPTARADQAAPCAPSPAPSSADSLKSTSPVVVPTPLPAQDPAATMLSVEARAAIVILAASLIAQRRIQAQSSSTQLPRTRSDGIGSLYPLKPTPSHTPVLISESPRLSSPSPGPNSPASSSQDSRTVPQSKMLRPAPQAIHSGDVAPIAQLAHLAGMGDFGAIGHLAATLVASSFVSRAKSASGPAVAAAAANAARAVASAATAAAAVAAAVKCMPPSKRTVISEVLAESQSPRDMSKQPGHFDVTKALKIEPAVARRPLDKLDLVLEAILAVNRESDDMYHCPHPDCSLKFRRRFNLKSHYSAVHIELRRFECVVCGHTFARKRDLLMHQRRVKHGIKGSFDEHLPEARLGAAPVARRADRAPRTIAPQRLGAHPALAEQRSLGASTSRPRTASVSHQ